MEISPDIFHLGQIERMNVLRCSHGHSPAQRLVFRICNILADGLQALPSAYGGMVCVLSSIMTLGTAEDGIVAILARDGRTIRRKIWQWTVARITQIVVESVRSRQQRRFSQNYLSRFDVLLGEHPDCYYYASYGHYYYYYYY
jgi:hypothetical protein